jgi:hypothetical protein
MSENRRWEARVEARIKVVVVRGRRGVSQETTDVSFKGLFLRTDEPPPLRSLLKLRVSLPQGEIQAHAMVVHVGALGVGVQFWGLEGPERAAWTDFVRELVQRQRASSAAPKKDAKHASAKDPSSGVRRAAAEPARRSKG